MAETTIILVEMVFRHTTSRAPTKKRCDSCFGSWSCKNALAIASTPRDDGDVAARGHFRRLVDFSVWKRF
jgi:hypothetical protein